MSESAEKEASEVLHTLLGIERIEKQNLNVHENNIVLHKIDSNDGIVDTKSIDERDPNSTLLDIDQTDYDSEIEEEFNVQKPSKKQTSDKGHLTNLEDCPKQVSRRLKQGCECKEGCFEGLSEDNVYKHRLNIADLTKEEHDMYLMGLIMACLGNREKTTNSKQRIRQRASYIYQGKKVCLDAFLYLENVTHYHLKRIRNHVMKNGITPRVHGNMGKKPHNTFSLDLYKKVEEFLKSYLKQFSNDLTRHIVVYGETRSNIYNKYKTQIYEQNVNEKLMGYSSFRHFMRKQFPNVRFSPKIDTPKSSLGSTVGHAILPKIGKELKAGVQFKSDSLININGPDDSLTAQQGNLSKTYYLIPVDVGSVILDKS